MSSSRWSRRGSPVRAELRLGPILKAQHKPRLPMEFVIRMRATAEPEVVDFLPCQEGEPDPTFSSEVWTDELRQRADRVARNLLQADFTYAREEAGTRRYVR